MWAVLDMSDVGYVGCRTPMTPFREDDICEDCGVWDLHRGTSTVWGADISEEIL